MLKERIVNGRNVYEFDLYNSGQIKVAEKLIGCQINSRILFIPAETYFDFLAKFRELTKKNKCETKIEELRG